MKKRMFVIGSCTGIIVLLLVLSFHSVIASNIIEQSTNRNCQILNELLKIRDKQLAIEPPFLNFLNYLISLVIAILIWFATHFS